MVKCPYKDRCKSYPLKCSICARNEEQDFFIPKQRKRLRRYPWVLHERQFGRGEEVTSLHNR